MKTLRVCRQIILGLCGLIQLSGCVEQRCNLTELRVENSLEDTQYLNFNSILKKSKLTYEDIIEIALCRNLSLLVKQWGVAVQREATRSETLTMLPDLIFSADATERNNLPVSSSQSVVPDIPPAPPSFSTDRQNKKWDLALSWNLLDFGMSYFRARQASEKTTMLQIEYKRLQQNLILDITEKYWDVIAAQKAMEITQITIEQYRVQLGKLKTSFQKKIIPKTLVMDSEDLLADAELRYEGYKKDYHQGLMELYQLMGIIPSTPFELIEVTHQPLLSEPIDIHYLEEKALLCRPELSSYDLQEKIDISEVRLEALNLFPGLEVFGMTSYDNNRFLEFNYWKTIGGKLIWNLFSLPSQWYNQRSLKNQISFTKSQRLELSLATLAQVHLAYLDYLDTLEHYLLAKKLFDVRQEKLKAAETQNKVGKINEMEVITYARDFYDAEIRLWRIYGDLQLALERLNNAIGISRFYHPEDSYYETPSHYCLS